MKGINIHQKSKKLQILMAKGWNISFWVKNMEGQVFAKIFHCGGRGGGIKVSISVFSEANFYVSTKKETLDVMSIV